MKFFAIIVLAILSIVGIAFADTTQSRDGEGSKIQGASFASIRSGSLGTKGFKCFSTASKLSWEVKAVATTATSGTPPFNDTVAVVEQQVEGFKMFYNGDESISYPVTDKFFQYQNAPVSKTPTITKVCLRAYSSATQKSAFGIFQ